MSHYATLTGLGRAVAYFPKVGIYLGNPLAGIFLSQLIYWHDKTEHQLGVYKTSEEWTEETGLSYRQQVTARTLLKKLGILTETEKRLEHKLYFKLDIEEFDKWFDGCTNPNRNDEQIEGNSPDLNSEIPERQIRSSGEYENAVRGDTDAQSVIHNITTEITTNNYSQENSAENSVDEVLNIWKPNLNSLNAWLQRSGEKPMTADQVEQVLLEVNSHYGPRLRASLISDTQMYSNFVKWIKRQPVKKYKVKSGHTKSQDTNRNVNAAWANQPGFTGQATNVEIPEDFV